VTWEKVRLEERDGGGGGIDHDGKKKREETPPLFEIDKKGRRSLLPNLASRRKPPKSTRRTDRGCGKGKIVVQQSCHGGKDNTQSFIL